MSCQTTCDGDFLGLGDVGTVIDVDACTDISTGTTFQLLMLKPDRTTEVIWSATLHPTINTKIRYVTAPGDLDQAGQWLGNVRVVLPTGTFTSPAAFNFYVVDKHKQPR